MSDTSPIEAHLPDGTILQFPAGTDPAIVQSTVKKQLGIQTAPITPAAPQGKSVEDFLFNRLPTDAVNYATSIASAVRHPLDTAGGLGNLLVAAGQKVTGNTSMPLAQGFGAPAVPAGDQRPILDALYNDVKQGVTHPLDTLYNRPVSTLSNIASIVGGGAGLGSKMTELGGMGRTAAVLDSVGQKAALLDPLSAILSGVMKPTAGSSAEAVGDFAKKQNIPLNAVDYSDRIPAKLVRGIQYITDRASLVGRGAASSAENAINKAIPAATRNVGADVLSFINNAVPESFRKGESALWDKVKMPQTSVSFDMGLPPDRPLLPPGRGPNTTGPSFVAGPRGVADASTAYNVPRAAGGHLNPFLDVGTPTAAEIGQVVKFDPELAARYPELFGPDRPVQALPTEDQVLADVRRQIMSDNKNKPRLGQPISQKDRTAILIGEEPGSPAGPGRHQQTSLRGSPVKENAPPTYSPGEDPRALLGAQPVPGAAPPNPYPQSLPPTKLVATELGGNVPNPFKQVGERYLAQYPNLSATDSPILSFAQKLADMPETLSPDEIKFRRTEIMDQARRDPNLLGNSAKGLRDQITAAATESLRSAADEAGVLPELDAARAFTREGRAVIDAKGIKSLRRANPEQLPPRLLNPKNVTLQNDFNALTTDPKLTANFSPSGQRQLGDATSGLSGLEQVQNIAKGLGSKNHVGNGVNILQTLGELGVGPLAFMQHGAGGMGKWGAAVPALNEAAGALFSKAPRTAIGNNLLTTNRRYLGLLASALARGPNGGSR